MTQKDPELYNDLFLSASTMLERGNELEDIEKTLLTKTDDIILVTVVLKEAKNNYHSILRKQGFRLVLIGCITGILGFMITFLNFNTHRSFDVAMYGLTSAGLVIVFWGFFKILG